MIIDAATRNNLELTRTLGGESRGSLLHAIDRTVSAAGARLLAQRLAQPLTDIDAIQDRLDSLSFFTAEAELCGRIRSQLRMLPDFARAMSRLSLGRGGPRDLASLRDGLKIAAGIAAIAADIRTPLPAEVAAALAALAASPSPLIASLDGALGEELPLLARDGGFVRAGHSPALDAERRLRDETRQVIAALQSRYAEETGIKSLKVKHNNVLG
jgi:DNA mismatch repair protein MutS